MFSQILLKKKETKGREGSRLSWKEKQAAYEESPVAPELTPRRALEMKQPFSVVPNQAEMTKL